MKFNIKMHSKSDRHREHWLLGVRLSALADFFSISMKKGQYPQSVNIYNPVLMTSFLKLSVVMQ